jgi:hypothetical protein
MAVNAALIEESILYVLTYSVKLLIKHKRDNQ